MAPRTTSVISCCLQSQPLPTPPYFSLTALLCKRQRVALAWWRCVGEGCVCHAVQETADHASPWTSHFISAIYILFPPNEMRLSTDLSIPGNVVLFKPHKQTRRWVGLKPSSGRCLLTLMCTFIVRCSAGRDLRPCAAVNLNSAYAACYKMRDIII